MITLFGKWHFKTLAAALSLLIVLRASPAHAGQVAIDTPVPNDATLLTVDEVNTIIAQAVGYLKSVNESGIISVVDREGHILAIFRMTLSGGLDLRINEQATVKARTAAFFESGGNAFTTRTAQFIVQSNFPPGVRNVDAGPLFGVPFSNFPGSDVQLQVPPSIVFVAPLNVFDATRNVPPCINAPAGNTNKRPILQPLVITPLTDDLGGIPLFKAGQPCGGVGVEIDGFGVLADGIPDAGVERLGGKSKVRIEEQAAIAASKGFEAPKKIRGDRITINGFRFPFVKTKPARSVAVPAGSLASEGAFEPYFDTDGSERSPGGTPLANAYTGTFSPTAVTQSAVRGTPTQEFPKQGFVPRFPPRDSPLGAITAADVRQMVQQAADRAATLRAGIRNPKGAAAQVWICVVDLDGNICGSFRTNDATVFSFDVHVQKARTASFFSSNNCGISSRGLGFMAQTFYPPGVEKSPSGPMSGLLNPDGSTDLSALNLASGSGRLTEISQLLIDKGGTPLGSILVPIPPCPPSLATVHSTAVKTLAQRLPHIRDGRLSPLQVGITVDLTLGRPSAGATPPATQIPNGITIFPGGVPIYKNGVLVGGLGVSGDGVDQDDIIAFAGQQGFGPPDGVRCDEASDPDIIAALQAAVVKLKTQFPNLTNGNNAVLDVITTRLQNPKALQGLRIPYVKFPRSPDR